MPTNYFLCVNLTKPQRIDSDVLLAADYDILIENNAINLIVSLKIL